jgi:hypothetical protein
MKPAGAHRSLHSATRPQVLALFCGLVAAFAGVTHARNVSACSCTLGAVNDLQTGLGQIPANAGGIVWWFAGGDGEFGFPRALGSDVSTSPSDRNASVTLQRWDGSVLETVASRIEHLQQSRPDVYLIRPSVPWSAGERYQLTVDGGPQYGNAETRIRSEQLEIVLPLRAADPELEIGAVQRGKVPFLVTDGSCAAEREAAYADIQFGAPDGARDWPAELLLYETYVDGVAWSHSSHLCAQYPPGASWVSRTGNRLVAACAAPTGSGELAKGVHRVRMEARLPGSDALFRTPETSVELRCGAPASAPTDIEAVPAAELPAAGCALSAGASSEPAAGGLGLVAVALALLRRSRRERAGRCSSPLLEE